MGRRLSRADHEKIIAEFAWTKLPVDPNRCGCRHVICVKNTGHALGECPHPPTNTVWTHRLVYFCETCREYHDGAKAVRGMVVR
jgi:hypothetical protein